MKLLVVAFIVTISVKKLSGVSGAPIVDIVGGVISNGLNNLGVSPDITELYTLKAKFIVLFAVTDNLLSYKWNDVLETTGPKDDIFELNTHIKTRLSHITWTQMTQEVPALNTISIDQAKRFNAHYEQRMALRNALYESLLSDLTKAKVSKSAFDAAIGYDKKAKRDVYKQKLQDVEARLNLLDERRNKWANLMCMKT